LGSSSVVGSSFVPIFDALSSDPATKAVLVIGQLSGQLENDLAEAYQMRRRKKPLIVYIPGRTMQKSIQTPLIGEKALSPAGIVAEKRAVLEKAGGVWVDNPAELGRVVACQIQKKDAK
jgi:succinyl-CoA synthetase alpha subunit